MKGRATNQLNQLALTSDMPSNNGNGRTQTTRTQTTRTRTAEQPVFNPNTTMYVRCSCEHGDDVQQQGFKPWGSERSIPNEMITSKLDKTEASDCHVCRNDGMAVIDYGCYMLLVDPIGLTGKDDKERVYNSKAKPRFPRKPSKSLRPRKRK